VLIKDNKESLTLSDLFTNLEEHRVEFSSDVVC